MTGTELMLWAPVQTFNGGPSWLHPVPTPEIRYRPPRDTTDPRYAACTRHWVACDCREAHMAEDRAELRAYADQSLRQEQAIDAVLALHSGPTASGWCAGCSHVYPCPTRNLLAPLSWRERYQSREDNQP